MLAHQQHLAQLPALVCTPLAAAVWHSNKLRTVAGPPIVYVWHCWSMQHCFRTSQTERAACVHHGLQDAAAPNLRAALQAQLDQRSSARVQEVSRHCLLTLPCSCQRSRADELAATPACLVPSSPWLALR